MSYNKYSIYIFYKTSKMILTEFLAQDFTPNIL